MTQTHTAEPWSIVGGSGIPYTQIIHGKISVGKVSNLDNARRIVQCVNACAGIPDPAAELARLRKVEEDAKAAGFIDDAGNVRKVLPATQGPQLFLTTDGCLITNLSAFVYAFEMAPGPKFTGNIIPMKYATWFDTRWDDCLPPCWTDKSPDRVWGCYSTRAAAEAARGGGA